MLVTATLEVASISLIAFFGSAFLIMGYWDQRHDRTTNFELQLLPPRLRFYSGVGADTNSAAQRHGETAEGHHLPSPPTASPTESPRLRAVEQG
jgi:hypothetical protein